MAERFPDFQVEEIQELKENSENQNGKKSTSTWLTVWTSWVESKNFETNLLSYEAKQLDETLQKFFAEIRKKDCSEYEPDSLRFSNSRKVLEGKARLLRQEGFGKRPNAAKALTSQDEELLWSKGVLGSHYPQSLIQTMWFLLTQHFGLRGCQEHHDMYVEDFAFSTDDNGIEFVTYEENPTKTRQGGLRKKRRVVQPKMFATEMRNSGPFYLALNERPTTQVWYKRQRMGVNSINSFMKNMASQADIQGKKFTNHSARKTLVKKLKAANQPRSAIIGVTGHTNERSLADYKEGDEKEQRLISSIISAECATAQSSRVRQPLERLDVVNIAVANTFLMNDERSATVNNFHGCQVTINYNI
ncbi:unnamed protein product, partial [Porites lobata]